LEEDLHLVGFRDAAPGEPSHRLSLRECFSALYKAKKRKWIDLKNFNCKEYEELEQPVNGDMNWIIPGKLLAFASPTDITKELNPEDDGRGETITHPPSRFIPLFKKWNVTTVVRLNYSNEYDRNAFIHAGIDHHDMYFVDGTQPPSSILDRFLNVVESTPGAVAVHCKAGLGRTGTLNGCYIMKHYGLTSRETIAFTRIMRPGSIIGPQQHFLEEWERRYLPKIRPAIAQAASDASSNDAGSDQMEVDEVDGVPVAAVAAEPNSALDTSSSSATSTGNHKKRERSAAPTQPRKFKKSAHADSLADATNIPKVAVSTRSSTAQSTPVDKRRKIADKPT
jgi:protein-tyrosine phosphatase